MGGKSIVAHVPVLGDDRVENEIFFRTNGRDEKQEHLALPAAHRSSEPIILSTHDDERGPHFSLDVN